MRTKYLAIAFAIAVLLCAFVPVTNGVLADDSVSVEIDEENFPDDSLRNTVREFDTNGDKILSSDEMTGYGLSDSEFLNRLYKTFMDRDPDDDGQAFWLDYMKSNDRSSVVFGFTRSPEFTEKCVKVRILPYS